MTTRNSSSPVISTPSGPVRGFQTDAVRRFTGIPYAKAKRFEAPQPVEPWIDVFDAIKPVPACPQPEDPAAAIYLGVSVTKELPVDEHCQKVSITTPLDIGSDEQLRVMVWCHGGAFVYGAADIPVYDPSRLVSEQRVIVVSVGSRLGVYGYLGDGLSRPANLGLLDVIEALRWIKKNIAAFGGLADPRTITMFGQSAGGSTISDIMASPEAKSLFGRAIIQSAPFGITRGRDAMNKALFENVRHASASLSTEEINVLAEKVIETGRSWRMEGGMPFAPQYGFAPLPAESKIDTVLSSCAPDIDVLVGSTAQEVSLFVSLIPKVGKAALLPVIGPITRRAVVSLGTPRLYTKGAKAFARRHVKAGGKASLYTITWGSKDPLYGAMHTCELPLLFGNKETWKNAKFLTHNPWEDVEESGKKLRRIWADFAKGKQPTAEDSAPGIITIAQI